MPATHRVHPDSQIPQQKLTNTAQPQVAYPRSPVVHALAPPNPTQPSDPSRSLHSKYHLPHAVSPDIQAALSGSAHQSWYHVRTSCHCLASCNLQLGEYGLSGAQARRRTHPVCDQSGSTTARIEQS
ncbi:hypothetical protein HBI56_203040 [Parastagonospora nodorum]|nr:hypothetical protein HBH51_178750 [Parastagonospora nodorum]KAH3997732.1 hypothetical protein HBI10_137980 [Parastagonospora nodorum]KAH4119260.1 hypothetical protein HBH47_127220 [Parastagonospora nodorum]KAH4285514.1 hypothetical protein HBI02_229370 [Parastagonospora nodorum]KAH4295513.1 hypothetical protein HBI01_155660 [Parastagonospora nodorum]